MSSLSTMLREKVDQRTSPHQTQTQTQPLPDHAAEDRTATSSTSGEQQGNRQQRRARPRTLGASGIEKRNRAQLVPHYLTAGLVALAGAIHQAAMQAHTLPAAALLAGVGTGAVGTVGYLWLRTRRRLLTGWTSWYAAVAAAASVWMVLAVAAGLTWGSLAVALAAEYALGSRWWKRHRHPAAVEPETDAEPEVVVDDSLIATYIHRWNDNVRCPNGALPDSSLTYIDTFDRGIEYVLHLKRGQQTIDQVRNNLGRIGTGIGRRPEHLVVEPRDDGDEDDPAQVTLRVITSSPVKESVLFRELRYHDGHIPLGPYADGIGEALWRLYTDDSMWGGLAIGATGTGKSRLLEMIALEALYTGVTYVMHLDGQDGSSCPVLWNHAQERYGVDDVDRLLDRLARMLRRRNQICGGAFTPSPGLPGVLVVVDETNAVLDRDNLKRWLHIARQGRKCGIAVVMGDQDGSLETFISSTFRGQLRKGNAVGLKTEESSQGQILGKGKIDLSELPEIPGFGYTLGNVQRRAPYKGRFLMAKKDADRDRQRGHAVPDDLTLIEQWYANAPKVPLDTDTDDDPGESDAAGSPSHTPNTSSDAAVPKQRQPELRKLVPMALPTVAATAPKPAEPEPGGQTTGTSGQTTGTSLPGLSDRQYQVYDAVTLGVSQPGQIADQLGLSRQRVGTVLGELVDKGLVSKSGAGRSVTYTAVADQQAG